MMFSPDQYQLLDFGGGRRLERFGGVDAGSALSDRRKHSAGRSGGLAPGRRPIRPQRTASGASGLAAANCPSVGPSPAGRSCSN